MQKIYDKKNKKEPSVLMSIIPILVLIVSLVFVVRQFDVGAMEGASQSALLFASAVCVAIGMIIYRIPWNTIEEGIKEKVSDISSALILLLLIGAIGGTWMLSGIVPTMIYYGLQIIDARFFILICCVVSAVVSLVTGSSWTTIATIGVALMGIGKGQGLPVPWIAGAIISGAYFGDKLSPLSDTTVIASSSAGAPLFTHIKYMLITTIPSMLIAMLIFLIAGFTFSQSSDNDLNSMLQALNDSFNISNWILVIPLITILMILFKFHSLIVLFVSSLLAAIAIPIAQPDIASQIIGVEGDISLADSIKSMLIAYYENTSVVTTDELLTELVKTKGMSGMMNTIWLIITAMVFGGVMVSCGMIATITKLIMGFVNSTFSLVTSTIFTGIFCNICISDHYLSIVLTSNIFKDYYDKNGYEDRLLSRSVEDSATATSVLIPWNTCGMTQSSVLNVSTWEYIPYCFFNIISPIMSIVVAAFGYKIFRKESSSSDLQEKVS